MTLNNKLIPVPFADKASNTWKHEIKERRASNDPANTADYEQGFPAVTMTEVLAGGIPPDGQDFNGILNHITTAIRYMQAGNLAEYNEEFALKIGGYSNLAIVSSNGVLYRSKSDNNTAKLDDTSKWELLISNDPNSASTTTVPTSNALKQVSDKTRVISINDAYQESRLSNPAESIFIYVRDDKVVGCHNLHNGKAMFYMNSDGYFEVNGVKIPNINEVFKLGDFRLFPFPPNELPAGWYLRNGDRHPVDSNIGKALKSLSEDYKFRWLIFEIDGYINLPNAFNYNGDGYFERAVDGVKRQAGSIQVDTIRNIRGWFTATTGSEDVASGVFLKERSTQGYTQWGARYNDGRSIVFDASRVVPTSHENRPINVGMTPAIYLGV